MLNLNTKNLKKQAAGLYKWIGTKIPATFVMDTLGDHKQVVVQFPLDEKGCRQSAAHFMNSYNRTQVAVNLVLSGPN